MLQNARRNTFPGHLDPIDPTPPPMSIAPVISDFNNISGPLLSISTRTVFLKSKVERVVQQRPFPQTRLGILSTLKLNSLHLRHHKQYLTKLTTEGFRFLKMVTPKSAVHRLNDLKPLPQYSM